ncbi:uncharacterized protein LOC109609304 [Aethina tumida]|uniref:uncharacterized protein LOC109609304 n=1 Tax=Aethina tumida TaxID=116153 RepID=UPI00096B0426|nr:uncharacterized protein LOC109609304 [Aethina tumida]
MLPCAVFFVVIFASIVGTQGVPRPVVTNEDIRDAILQMVKVVKLTEDKLERHEYRERVLGDNIKKGLMIIEKRIKVLDPLKGSFQRLDERLAAVESFLLQKDEREKAQIQKIVDFVEDFNTNFPTMLDKLRDDIIDKLDSNEPPAQITEPTVSKKEFQKLEKDLLEKVDKVAKSIGGIEKDLSTIRDDNKKFHDVNTKSTENLDKVKRQLDNSEELLHKFDNKLSEYNKIPLASPTVCPKIDEKWQNNVTDGISIQKQQLNKLAEELQQIGKGLSVLPQKNDLQTHGDMTLERLEDLKQLALRPSEIPKNLSETLAEIRKDIQKNHDDLNTTLTNVWDVSSGLASGIPVSYDQIRNDIQSLNRLEKVMMQTADNVLDTKRKVEYGILKTITDLGGKMKDNSKDVINAVNERFDGFETSILDEDSGALSNLTGTMRDEIAEVWRQIGIMHQQMTASTDTLNKLQDQTDLYVNGSMNVMDKMTGKVGSIKKRMEEVDENLNYLMGRLSLVTHEFDQIRTGLGKALDQIRGSFKAVQDKVKDAGPGPHNITSNEVQLN